MVNLTNTEMMMALVVWFIAFCFLLGFIYYMLNVFGKIEPERSNKKSVK